MREKKKDNLVFFCGERVCFNNFLNIYVKTLNDIYFQIEGVLDLSSYGGSFIYFIFTSIYISFLFFDIYLLYIS